MIGFTPDRNWLKDRVTGRVNYAGFTDIEFNPSKSINCQARSCALFVSLMKNNKLQQAVASPQEFTQLISHYDYHPHLRSGNGQDAFFQGHQELVLRLLTFR